MIPGDGDGPDGAVGAIEAGRVVELGSVNKQVVAANSAQPQNKTADPVVIVVAPAGRGKFRASLDGGPELVRASATPFLSGCRKLLGLG